MKITYSLNKTDLYNLEQFLKEQERISAKNKKVKIKLILTLAFIILIGLLKFDVHFFLEIKYMCLAVFLLFGIIVFFPRIEKLYDRLTIKKNIRNIDASFAKSYSYELTQDGIKAEASDGSKGFWKYKKISGICYGIEIAYIFFDESDVLIIPYDRIPENDRREFIRILSKEMEE